MGSPTRPLCGPVGELSGPPRRAIYRTCAQRRRTEKLPEKSQQGLYKRLAATQSRVTWSNPSLPYGRHSPVHIARLQDAAFSPAPAPDGTPPYACRDFRESRQHPSDTGNTPHSHQRTGTNTLHPGSAAESDVGTRDLRRSGGRHWQGGASVHFLQCCQHPGRVLDEHSTHTTAPRLWGRVSRGTAAHRTALCEALATGARRPSWHVEYAPAPYLWRCASRLSRVG